MAGLDPGRKPLGRDFVEPPKKPPLSKLRFVARPCFLGEFARPEVSFLGGSIGGLGGLTHAHVPRFSL